MTRPLFRDPGGALPNGLAFAYVGAGYLGGLWLMASAPLPIALLYENRLL